MYEKHIIEISWRIFSEIIFTSFYRLFKNTDLNVFISVSKYKRISETYFFVSKCKLLIKKK